MQKADLLNFKFNKFFKQIKYLVFLFAIFVAAFVGLFLPRGAAQANFADWVASGVLDLLSPIIYIIFWILFFIAYLIAWFGAGVMNLMLNPAIINSVLNNTAIYQSWAIFRDVANLLFILLLLLIALGTIFRSESYNIKKSLYKFILVIFLINFSAMIAGIFIDFGNYLMYGLLKMMCTMSTNACFQNFFNQLMGVIDALYSKYKLTGAFSFDFKDAAAMAIATIYTFIYGLILIALGLFLFLRVAALAVLIILSPLAFLGYTAPGLEGLKNKWWDNLVQYVMFGPVFALMLYVSGLMTKNTIAVDPAVFSANPNMAGLSGDFAMIITYSVPLIFLIGIIPVTRAFGIAGSNAILGMTTGVAAFAGGYLGSATDRWLARGAGMKGGDSKMSRAYAGLRRGMSNLSPGAWKRAYKAHKAEQEHDYDIATGRQRNKLDEPITSIKDRLGMKTKREIDHEKRAAEVEAEATFKAKGITNTDEMIDELNKDIEKRVRPQLRIKEVKWLASEDALDDYLDRTVDPNTGQIYGKGAMGLSNMLKNNFSELAYEERSKLAAELHRAEKRNNNIGYAGVGRYDTATSRYMFNNMSTAAEMDEQANEQLKTFNSMDDISRMKVKGSSWTQSRISPVGAPLPAGTPKEEISLAGMGMIKDVKGAALDRVKNIPLKTAAAIHDDLKYRYKAPVFVPATKTVPAHYDFSVGTPAEIREFWERLMREKQLS